MTTKEIYLNGIALAHKWLLEAQFSNDQTMVVIYQRMLDDAIDKYETLFNGKN